MIKKLLPIGLLAIGNEIISLAVLCVLCFIGVRWLMTEAAKGGFFS